MDLETLENRVQEIERAVQRLLDDIHRMKAAQPGPSLEDVIKSIECDLPEEIDLESTLDEVRDR